ncbi:hypothetical protein [Ferviditalea candida]|uniref:YfhO family protein n=1 Tax=Ferviditalea candida TaxID=3108399 RepID=A0ABU5ZIK7_9BACL|nr:YfhO family protein [Paenibacillaceae bacterium T2]
MKNFLSNPWLCAGGGLAYATSGLFVGNAEHLTFIFAAMIYPLLHYSTHKLFRTKDKKWTVLIGLSLGLLILNNYPPFFILSVLFLLLEMLFYLLFVSKDRENLCKFICYSVVSIVFVAISVSLVAIYTDVQVVNHITRSKLTWVEATQSSLNFWNWLGIITPFFVQLTDNNVDVSMGNTYIALPITVFALSKLPNSRKEFNQRGQRRVNYSKGIFQHVLSFNGQICNQRLSKRWFRFCFIR